MNESACRGQCRKGLYAFVAITVCLAICTQTACDRTESKSPKQARSTTRKASENRKAASNVDRTPQEKQEKPKLPNVALILVDLQQDFFDTQVEAANPEFIGNVSSILSDCRKVGVEVIHVRSSFAKDIKDRLPGFQKFFGEKIPCVVGSAGARTLECARNLASEKVFYKNSFDPFADQALLEYLKERKIGNLLVCGLTTDVCVLSTCFSSTNHGFNTILIEDASAASNPMAHQFVVRRYQGMLFETVKAKQIIDRIAAIKAAFAS